MFVCPVPKISQVMTDFKKIGTDLQLLFLKN